MSVTKLQGKGYTAVEPSLFYSLISNFNQRMKPYTVESDPVCTWRWDGVGLLFNYPVSPSSYHFIRYKHNWKDLSHKTSLCLKVRKFRSNWSFPESCCSLCVDKVQRLRSGCHESSHRLQLKTIRVQIK